MEPTTLIETHNMETKFEDEPLPWYLVNSVIYPYTGVILQYRDRINLKKKPLAKRIFKMIWKTCRRFSRNSKKRDKHYSVCRTQQYTNGTHGKIIINHG